MSEGGLTIFAHLDPCETDRVVVYLMRAELWNWGSMIYDCDASILMTTTGGAKEVVMEALAEMDLLPEGEATYSGG